MSENWDDYAAGWDGNAAVIAYADNAYLALKNTVNDVVMGVAKSGQASAQGDERE